MRGSGVEREGRRQHTIRVDVTSVFCVHVCGCLCVQVEIIKRELINGTPKR
jgi:hypothetical protein